MKDFHEQNRKKKLEILHAVRGKWQTIKINKRLTCYVPSYDHSLDVLSIVQEQLRRIKRNQERERLAGNVTIPNLPSDSK